MSGRIAVVIPTQRRPAGAVRAARSALRQPDRAPDALVIVDNDRTPSAREALEEIRSEAEAMGVVFRYAHEPVPGVARARNAAMKLVEEDFVAFLDDDEEAGPAWLAELSAAQAALQADVVFGPIEARLPGAVSAHDGHYREFFSRRGPTDTQVILGHYGCGNSLLRRGALVEPEAPFDVAYDRSGGEDDRLFMTLREQGARFAWAARAVAFEHPAPDRLRLSYTLRRAFSFGQGTSRFRKETGGAASLAWSMATGLAQALVWGGLALAGAVLRPNACARLLDRAARGAGKAFWMARPQEAFYGSAPGGERPGPPSPDASVAVSARTGRDAGLQASEMPLYPPPRPATGGSAELPTKP